MSSRLTLLLVAIGVLTSACATGVDTAAAGTTSLANDAAVAEVSAPDVATVGALWWTADTLDGDTFVAADLAGQRVVLWMWAPWCSVCNREAPEVAAAIADLPDDVTVIGIAGRDDVEPMRAFVEEHGLEGITHVVDADGAVWASYGISYQPAWVFVDEAGEAAVAAGALGYDGIFAGIEQVFGS
jgi:thiol-disulfide isomerase/thioredoxin